MEKSEGCITLMDILDAMQKTINNPNRGTSFRYAEVFYEFLLNAGYIGDWRYQNAVKNGLLQLSSLGSMIDYGINWGLCEPPDDNHQFEDLHYELERLFGKYPFDELAGLPIRNNPTIDVELIKFKQTIEIASDLEEELL